MIIQGLKHDIYVFLETSYKEYTPCKFPVSSSFGSNLDLRGVVCNPASPTINLINMKNPKNIELNASKVR